MEAFSVDRLGELLGAPLPTATRKALELAYLLSTQQEEGRPLRFGFLLSPYIQFLPERKLNPIASGGEAIRRLCLAADPRENCWRLSFDESTGAVAVTGLANYPFDLSLPSPLEGTYIEVEGVASVSIRVGDARAKYAGCRHYVPTGETVLRNLIPAEVVEAVAQHCLTTTGLTATDRYVPWGQGAVTPLDYETYVAHRTKLETLVRQAASDVVPAVVLMTVRRMRELHHGGGLILLNQESLPVPPADLFAKFASLSPISDTGPSKYGYNWASLAFVQALAHSTLAAREGIVMLRDLKEKSLDEAKSLLRDLHLTLFDREAARYTRVWAQLSVIDGIVVMSSVLEPLVFGGLVSVPPDFTEVRDKGTRHRSAAYCATRLLGSVAVVVSQDGAVTAYRKPSADAPLETVELLL
jgi:hypothetical protein